MSLVLVSTMPLLNTPSYATLRADRQGLSRSRNTGIAGVLWYEVGLLIFSKGAPLVPGAGLEPARLVKAEGF